MIYDFKTKEVGKFNKFYTTDQYQTFKGVMSDLTRNKANEYALQLSTYKLILERKGYNVSKLAIIPFEGDLTRDGDEFRYTNVRLYKDTTTHLDPDSVLKIDDLSEKMKDFYLEKDDVEQITETVDIVDKDINEMLEQASQLDSQAEWIKQLIVDIKKSVSRIRATADVTTATRYENEMKQLVERLMVEDEMMALTSYTAYIQRGLTRLYSKFFDKFELRKDGNDKEYREYVKGFDNYTWKDIKLLEETNPDKYVEFMAFLINADMFLQQVVSIKNLPYTDAKSTNLVLRTLKAQEYKISDLKLKIKRLNKELDIRYLELSSNPLHGGRGTIENVKDFFQAVPDETWSQSKMDSLADSHITYLANVRRLYDYKKRYMEDEIIEITDSWNKKIEELKEMGIDIKKFTDSSTGKIHPKIDYDRFYKDRDAMFKKLDKYYKGKRGKSWRNSFNEWMEKNTRLLDKEERQALIAKMKKELGTTPSSVTGKSGYQEWLERQTFTKGKGKKAQKYYKKTSPFYVPKPEVYANENYKNYSQKEKEFHDYLTSTLAYLVEHTKDSIVKRGYLPASRLERFRCL
jgi:hypothetical protein